jgi:hypothetical protein
MDMKTQRNRAVGWSAWLDEIKCRQRAYAKIFEIAPWTPDMLSDIGHLGLVDVPMLVGEVEKQRNSQCDEGNSDGDPGSDSVRLPEPPLQLVLPEETVAYAPLVVVTCNPLAHFLIVLLAKLPLGIRLLSHTSNENSVQFLGISREIPKIWV